MVYESGNVDADGRLAALGGGYASHHDVITRPEQVQVYESVMGDLSGSRTWSLLAAAVYLKDNRVPPRGFRGDGVDTESIRVRGVSDDDANFNVEGSGCDEVTYRFPVETVSGVLNAEVALLYQAVPPEAVEHLLKGEGPAARRFGKAYARMEKAPEMVHAVQLRW
jgi:hypothetical protein